MAEVCDHFSRGCPERFFTKQEWDIHVIVCNYRTVQCPLDSCLCLTMASQIVHHLTKYHDVMLLHLPLFGVTFTEFQEIKLIALDDAVYVLRLNSSVTRKMFELCLYIVTVTDQSKAIQQVNRSYHFKYSKPCGTLVGRKSKNVQVQILGRTKAVKNAIYLSHERSQLLTGSPLIMLHLNLDPLVTPPAVQNPLEIMLQCPICFCKVMMPPIFTCLTGHTVCGECIKKLPKCPTCKANYEGTRNFALEALSESVLHFCQHSPCTYQESLTDVRSHVAKCPHRPVNCPLKPELSCPWMGAFSGYLDHLKHDHSQRLYLNCSESAFSFLFDFDIKSDEPDEVNMLINNEDVFKMRVKVLDYVSVQWVVWQDVDWSQENRGFRYVLTLLDQGKYGRIIVLDKSCQIGSQGYGDGIKLPLDVLSPFISNGRVFYGLQIFPK